MRSAGGPFAARAATKAGGFDAGAGGSGHGPADAPAAAAASTVLPTRVADAQPLADRLERRAIGDLRVSGWEVSESCFGVAAGSG